MTNYPFVSSVVTVDHLQFAQNGIWEQVQTVYPDRFEDIYNLSNWLDRAPRDIAMEMLFMDEKLELSGFFGVRTKDLPSANRTLLWMRLATLVATKDNKPFSELVSLCLETLKLPSMLPKTKPVFEMGIFNFWNTAEPLKLGDSPFEEIKKLMALKTGSSWLYDGHEAPICFEYVWYLPAHIWISRNISVKSNNRYFIDMARFKRTYYGENQ
ncbi:hypothetical protein H1P_580031 [Hyella patelloides LEGE 07179]|uniref:Uncharacterized protein n=1 Tax=Hyella patelloides LEGE 07179 TaxID=945734 RepID=A0A563W0R4_9CYAN|nr:hypothetical protein [Hyella patelloides]VEP17284.1 hypothetical protein H1P_580031 [Hyella patelloides LEGE 07179]